MYSSRVGVGGINENAQQRERKSSLVDWGVIVGNFFFFLHTTSSKVSGDAGERQKKSVHNWKAFLGILFLSIWYCSRSL